MYVRIQTSIMQFDELIWMLQGFVSNKKWIVDKHATFYPRKCNHQGTVRKKIHNMTKQAISIRKKNVSLMVYLPARHYIALFIFEHFRIVLRKLFYSLTMSNITILSKRFLKTRLSEQLCVLNVFNSIIPACLSFTLHWPKKTKFTVFNISIHK